MKTEMPVKIVADACKKARKECNERVYPCPLYPKSICCEQECNVPKFLRWLTSDVEMAAADAPETDE